MNEIGMIGRITGAFGADDVARPRLVYRKLRLQLIADIWRLLPE